ncbi:MAG: fumarylacetoacetate hydrolase family protein, partial [Solirubrobacteraceae bacterium]
VERLVEMLGSVATATLASQLRKRGLDDCMLDGLASTRPELKLVGRARTLRYLPYRADLFRARGGGMNAQKRSVEAIEPGEVLVIEARGDTSAGTIGDLLAYRAQHRGAAGIVTDGAIRDLVAIGELGIPTYHAGSHSAVLGRRHVPWETDVAVACAGVAIEPGELLVGDADGVVVVPVEVAEDVARDAVEQERQERFIAEQLRAGASVVGLYPVGEEWQEAYATWCKKQAPR